MRRMGCNVWSSSNGVAYDLVQRPLRISVLSLVDASARVGILRGSRLKTCELIYYDSEPVMM